MRGIRAVAVGHTAAASGASENPAGYWVRIAFLLVETFFWKKIHKWHPSCSSRTALRLACRLPIGKRSAWARETESGDFVTNDKGAAAAGTFAGLMSRVLELTIEGILTKGSNWTLEMESGFPKRWWLSAPSRYPMESIRWSKEPCNGNPI